MRHNKKFNHLGRTASHRSAMLSNMACSLIKHKRITTTLAKAKALKVFVEPLITKSKDDSMHNRRVVFSNLKDKFAVTELFREISAKIGDRPGGYTRILRTGFRKGDAADMCIIELVDYNEKMGKEKAAKKSTRARRGSKKAEGAAAPAAPKAETKAKEAKVVEEVRPAVEEVKEEVAAVVETPEVAEEIAETPEVVEEAAPEVAEPTEEATEEPKAE
jgi:large subunit ribosomal protein L17